MTYHDSDQAVTANSNIARVQIDLPFERIEALDQLALNAGGLTRKELFNNALTLLSWAVQQAKRGRIIASINEKNTSYTELSLPFLDAVREQSAAPGTISQSPSIVDSEDSATTALPDD